MAGKGAAAAKSGFLAVWLAVLAPFIGIILGVISQWFIIRATTPPGRDRRARAIELIAVWTCVIGLSWGGETAVRALGHHYAWSDQTFFYAMIGFWWFYTAGLITWFMAMAQRNWPARQQREAAGDVVRLNPLQRVSLAAGMHLALFLWVIALAWNAHDPMTAAIVAGIMVGLAVLNYFNLRDLSGLAAARANCRHYGVCCLMILAVINLRMDVWLASRYEVSVAEIHTMFPMWLIPVLTVALLAWVGSLIAARVLRMPLGEQVTRN
jgi:hypothetical protein